VGGKGEHRIAQTRGGKADRFYSPAARDRLLLRTGRPLALAAYRC